MSRTGFESWWYHLIWMRNGTKQMTNDKKQKFNAEIRDQINERREGLK